MNSLKEPSACTSTRCPFTVTVAPGSVRPLICRMFARTSMVSMVSGGGGPSPCEAPLGRATVKREKSENLPVTPSLSTAATRQ